MINKKIIYFLLGRASFAMALAYILPICYAIFAINDQKDIIFFLTMFTICISIGTVLTYKGREHRNRIKISESAASMIVIWPLLIALGAMPFIMTFSLSPIDSILETTSNLTAAGVSFLPDNAPYILKLWQATLMWLGSFVFLCILVTILPEVSGCFGMELSLSQGQIFSPMLGQMRLMARKILIIYEVVTLISFVLFKIAGLEFWDALSMSMRCISTGGGNFFAGKGNPYVEYAAIFSMLMACGNFLFYFRLLNTILPPQSSLKLSTPIKPSEFVKQIHRLIINFIILIRRNAYQNLKLFFRNSEIQFLIITIFACTFFILFTDFSAIADGKLSFKLALFEVVSYMSTSGMSITNISQIPDYTKFILCILAIIGGCMGSVTGGLKAIRVIILFKLAKIETLKVIHPRMITSIKISGISVPMKIVRRVLSFFFLCSVTLFIFSVILSLSGQAFSTSVAMSIACLTNIGPLPGLCESSIFMALPAMMKLFCCFILIVGRMEIFAFLILLAYLHMNRERRTW